MLEKYEPQANASHTSRVFLHEWFKHATKHKCNLGAKISAKIMQTIVKDSSSALNDLTEGTDGQHIIASAYVAIPLRFALLHAVSPDVS